MSEPKYRPSLAANEIHYIISLCEADKTQPAMAHELLAKLKLFVAKMKLGIVNPAFSSSSQVHITLEDQLGFVDPAAKRKAAYEKWKVDPYLCNKQEFAMAETYRYENDLMTPEEEEDYEART